MAIVSNLKVLSIEVIEEYLAAANICLDTVKPGGGILGYPAALLLLCATDAIGHGLPLANRQHTRLDVLTHPSFGLTLHKKQIKNLTDWYRNGLAHSGLMVPGVYLDRSTEGAPFDFDTSGALTLIRIPVLYNVVKSAWERLDKSAFQPPSRHGNAVPDLSAQKPGFGSSLSPAASGTPRTW